MKKKMFAMLTISFMVMAAFGAVAVFAEDTAADDSQRVINEASGTVNYIPDVINVSVGGTVSFIPTVNWIETNTAIDSYTVTLKMSASEGDADSYSIGSEGNYALSDADFGEISIKGLKSGLDKTLTVTVTAEIYFDGGTTPIATRVVSKAVTVNVYDALTINGSFAFDTCYFGKEYKQDLLETTASIVSAGSGNYAISVTDLPKGLYVLGSTVAGMATADQFSEDSKTVKITVVDTKTGATKANTAVSMLLAKYVVSVTYGEAPVEQDTLIHVDQGESITFNCEAVYGETDAPGKVVLKSENLTFEESDGTTTATVSILGNHLVKVMYQEMDGDDVSVEQFVFTFNVFVVYNGIDFIVPEPGMVVTLTG